MDYPFKQKLQRLRASLDRYPLYERIADWWWPHWTRLRDLSRNGVWLIPAAAGILWLASFASHKVGIAIWLITKLSLAAWIGYWVDRLAFHYLRPHDMGACSDRGFRLLSRALIIGACIIAAGIQT